MGRETFTRTAFVGATEVHVPRSGPATKVAEQKAKATGKLNPLVDPAGYGVIRPSRPRFEEVGGRFVMTVGTPIPIETRLDTTGSMGGNVDIAIGVLPDSYELCSKVLPGYDLQLATGIFGDVADDFVLCRPQFEMTAAKIVEQLTLMVPERDGGDGPEDPHYGLFGAAYLLDAYIRKIGLKGYDFTVSDATCHPRLDERELRRIFGPEVFDKVAENGFQMKKNDLPSLQEMVRDLLKISHAFFLQVGDASHVTKFWAEIFGADRVVVLPEVKLLPQVQATIVGLTEGTLSLTDVKPFLEKNGVSQGNATKIGRSVANIPIGAQAALPNFSKRPQKGDVFATKTDTWPLDAAEVKVPAGGKKPPNEAPPMIWV